MLSYEKKIDLLSGKIDKLKKVDNILSKFQKELWLELENSNEDFNDSIESEREKRDRTLYDDLFKLKDSTENLSYELNFRVNRYINNVMDLKEDKEEIESLKLEKQEKNKTISCLEEDLEKLKLQLFILEEKEKQRQKEKKELGLYKESKEKDNDIELVEEAKEELVEINKEVSLFTKDEIKELLKYGAKWNIFTAKDKQQVFSLSKFMEINGSLNEDQLASLTKYYLKLVQQGFPLIKIKVKKEEVKELENRYSEIEGKKQEQLEVKENGNKDLEEEIEKCLNFTSKEWREIYEYVKKYKVIETMGISLIKKRITGIEDKMIDPNMSIEKQLENGSSAVSLLSYYLEIYNSGFRITSKKIEPKVSKDNPRKAKLVTSGEYNIETWKNMKINIEKINFIVKDGIKNCNKVIMRLERVDISNIKDENLLELATLTNELSLFGIENKLLKYKNLDRAKFKDYLAKIVSLKLNLKNKIKEINKMSSSIDKIIPKILNSEDLNKINNLNEIYLEGLNLEKYLSDYKGKIDSEAKLLNTFLENEKRLKLFKNILS